MFDESRVAIVCPVALCAMALWAALSRLEVFPSTAFPSPGDVARGFVEKVRHGDLFDDIVACGADHVVMEPCADMALFAEKHGRTCGFSGNADTRILLSGTHGEIRAEVERCMAIGKPHPGFIMAVGNHIPPNTPVGNALYYDEVYRELARR